MCHVSFFLPRILLHTTNAPFAYCCLLLQYARNNILPLTVKRKISILVLYYLEYANWIRDDDDDDDDDGGEPHYFLREPRHGMSGDNITNT